MNEDDIILAFDVTTKKINVIHSFKHYGFVNNKSTRSNDCLDNMFTNTKTDDLMVNVYKFPFPDDTSIDSGGFVRVYWRRD